MARPREFDEAAALDAAIECFWSRGYETTSVRDLSGAMGISGPSLYNTFGDKRTLFRQALDHYVERGVHERIRRCESELEPRAAISVFLGEMIELSLADKERKGCLIVNSALELSPHDAEFQAALTLVLRDIEAFFYRCAQAGQANGTINALPTAEDLARMLLGLLMGLRVLARSRPEPELLRGLIRPVLALLDTGVAPNQQRSHS
jgi:TetR/AcrR family transcriptional repressor of nem operon